ncbi:MAG TPA: helix-turn-helix transcriptional regulator [Caldisericia bacterium]|mgnify:CR=1 FL=1|jgi:transcriptional regulator with XRE-family HTH domain|nr:helix-turn-helix transcriptional regulator [Caldisericia bacterium]
MFGEFIKERRQKLGYTLREFCKKHQLDPGNWSRLERGLSKPPQNDKILNEYASYLEIEHDSAEYRDLLDLAEFEQGKIPRDLLKDNELKNLLPLFFRTVRETRPTEEDLIGIIEAVRSQYESEN